MLSTRAINSENLVASDGQPLKIIEAGASLFYTLNHPPGESCRSVSVFRPADPYDNSLIAMDIHRSVGGHQADISAVEFPDLSLGLGAFSSADELQVSQPFRHIQLLSGSQDILAKAEPHRGQESDNKEELE